MANIEAEGCLATYEWVVPIASSDERGVREICSEAVVEGSFKTCVTCLLLSVVAQGLHAFSFKFSHRQCKC